MYELLRKYFWEQNLFREFLYTPVSPLPLPPGYYPWIAWAASEIKYRKIPKILPTMYKPPLNGNAKDPPLNRSSKYKPPGGLYLENCPQIQSKTKQKR